MWVHKIKTRQKKVTILYTLLNRILIVKKEHIQYIEKRITRTNGWTELTVRGPLGVC